ncbi:MAG: SNF2 family helicase [Verrucomicrobia bacterium]|nr:SNF2 family helicase [Verrucomicrobiota bacterium]
MPSDWSDLPDLSRDSLVDLAGWAVLKEAMALFDAGAVLSVSWNKPVLSGELRSSPRHLRPRLNLRSLAFAENKCSCAKGIQGYVCAHAVALCIAAERARRTTETADIAEDSATAKPQLSPDTDIQPISATPQSLRLDATNGKPLHIRLLLPPNLASAITRDVVMVKLEVAADRELMAPEKLFRGTAYKIQKNQAAAAAMIETWCGGKLFSLLQLRRNQLVQLIHELRGQPVFAWVNQPDRPLTWQGDSLAGISELLETQEEPSPPIGNPLQPSPQVRRTLPSQPVQRESAVTTFLRERASLGAGPFPAELDGSSLFLSLRLPARDHDSYSAILNLVKDNDFRLEPGNGRWWLRDKHKVLTFLARFLRTLQSEYQVRFTPNFSKRTESITYLPVSIATHPVHDGFEVQVQLQVPGLTEQDVFRALSSHQLYLESGERIFLLQYDLLQRLQSAQQALSGDRSREVAPRFSCKVRPAALRDAERILTELDPEFLAPVDWRKRSTALQQVSALQAAPVPGTLDSLLRTYQRIGVAWLWHLYLNQLGGVLADEMGLGKTIQALALLSSIHNDSSVKCCNSVALVVCPAGLVENWRRECNRFAPQLKVAIHHREQRLESGEMANHDLVITSYSTLSRDDALFGVVNWAVIIADEAQHIKNRRTQAAASLRSLKSSARFVLTGTPLENSLDDLRSLFDFILPGYLTRCRSNSRDEREWLDQRHLEQAAPYILRRSKESVAPELPQKLEQIVYCPLTSAQETLYRKIQQQTEANIAKLELAGVAEQKVRFAALAQLVRLRQVCAEPRLLQESLLPEDSAKLNVLSELLNEALDGGHRVLIFSQFVEVLSHLRLWMQDQKLEYAYIDGSTRNRVAEAERFNTDPDIPVFLISLKAGGTGLNLTGADTVIHFDPWWNPAAEAQATDRAHRIGQKRQVQVYKLIASNTIEEKVLQLQSDKAALLEQLLEASTNRTASVSLKDIKDLLR